MSSVWQTFRGGPAKAFGNAVGVSISERGRISLSRGALRLIGNPSYVLLHYDERNGIIGITPSEAGTAGAFPVKLRPKECGGTIGAQPFCVHFRIKVAAVERFDQPALDENGILRLDLKRTHRIAKPNRRPKSEQANSGRGE
jgi:hypothetical protein